MDGFIKPIAVYITYYYTQHLILLLQAVVLLTTLAGTVLQSKIS